MMPTTIPAVVRASAIRACLNRALDGDFDVRCRYVVSFLGIQNQTTGTFVKCDTTDLYDTVGADADEKITVTAGGSVLEITRCPFVHNDLAE